ncbi:hypothetical protein GPL17_19185 [Bradyrhizobium yuanmingense]|nr:hypothetical protein [Bradyrhizobium yuanmingense]
MLSYLGQRITLRHFERPLIPLRNLGRPSQSYLSQDMLPRRRGRACPGHPRLAPRNKERGCPGQARA